MLLRLAPAALPVALSLLAGCYLSHERPGSGGPDGGADAGRDAGLDGGRDGGRDGGLDGGQDGGLDAGWDGGLVDCDGGTEPGHVSDVGVDLLFVVDNSGSMADEQLNLTENFPRMVTALGSGDLDGDGVEDFPPVASLRIGVVTTDLGVGGSLSTCGDPDGEDGVFRTRPGYTRRCDPTYPRWLSFRPGTGDSLAALAEDFHCLGRVGTDGCGIEQPLEAALKALTPRASPTRFVFGSETGHGDGANGGFLRDDSILAVFFVTDEDDCSIRDPRLWQPEGGPYVGDLRCVTYEDDALWAIERYVDGLRALRARDPARLVVGAITGIPRDLVTDPEAIDYEAILSDPRMVKQPNPLSPGQLLPSCTGDRFGSAEPPTRIVRTVQRFGESGIVQSICGNTFEGALVALTSRLGRVIRHVECTD